MTDKEEWLKAKESCVCDSDCHCNCYYCKCIMKRRGAGVTVSMRQCCQKPKPGDE